MCVLGLEKRTFLLCYTAKYSVIKVTICMRGRRWLSSSTWKNIYDSLWDNGTQHDNATPCNITRYLAVFFSTTKSTVVQKQTFGVVHGWLDVLSFSFHAILHPCRHNRSNLSRSRRFHGAVTKYLKLTTAFAYEDLYCLFRVQRVTLDGLLWFESPVEYQIHCGLHVTVRGGPKSQISDRFGFWGVCRGSFLYVTLTVSAL